jgi:hypothetical protein
MALTTKVGPYLDALAANLSARNGLSGVGVFSGWVGPDGGLRSSQIESVDSTDDWGLIGNRRLDEAVTLTGFIWAQAPGAGEVAIKAARDAAEAIWNELLDELVTNPSQGVAEVLTNAHVASMSEENAVNADKQRVCRITFTIALTAQITNT